jgi:hypothetical protein
MRHIIFIVVLSSILMPWAAFQQGLVSPEGVANTVTLQLASYWHSADIWLAAD